MCQKNMDWRYVSIARFKSRQCSIHKYLKKLAGADSLAKLLAEPVPKNTVRSVESFVLRLELPKGEGASLAHGLVLVQLLEAQIIAWLWDRVGFLNKDDVTLRIRVASATAWTSETARIAGEPRRATPRPRVTLRLPLAPARLGRARLTVAARPLRRPCLRHRPSARARPLPSPRVCRQDCLRRQRDGQAVPHER